jgi:hypothetical protein
MSGGGSRPPPELAELHGALRDALATLSNLEQLLASLRVAPKTIAALLPEASGTVVELRRSFDALAGVLTPELSSLPGPTALAAFREERLGRLEKALADAQRGAFNATRRVQLERALRDTSAELDTTGRVLQYLHGIDHEPLERVDPALVMRDAFAQQAPPSHTGVLYELSVSIDAGIEFDARPRVLIEGLGLIAGLVARPDARGLHVEIGASAGRPKIRITPGLRGAPTYSVLAAHPIPPLASCLASAAERVDMRLGFDEHGLVLDLP